MSDRFLKDLIGYHLNSSTKLGEVESDFDTDPERGDKIHHCQHHSSSSHLSRSPARSQQNRGSPVRQSSRSPLPDKLRIGNAAAAAAQATRSVFAAASASADLPPIGVRPKTKNEVELKQKIQVLEDTVAEYERQKFNVMGTFQEYRERVLERERKLEAEYSGKIISLSEEVLAAKRDFEERMKQFQALQEKFEREKEAALEKLRQEHQREIQVLEQRCSDSQLLNLEQKYMIEIQRLDEERKSLRSEKERLGEVFETKLKRAQALYETELAAAKALYTNELNALRDHDTALREELLARQEEFRDRLDDLNVQFQQSKEELEKCRLECIELEERLRKKEQEVQEVHKQLQEARKETDEALANLHRSESELEHTKQKYNEQQEQLQRKSDMLSALESARNKLEQIIQDLQQELKSLKNKVVFLENERQNLESQSRTQVQLQDSQLKAMNTVLDNLQKEKELLKEHYDQLLQDDHLVAEEREMKLKNEYTVKLNELERQHKSYEEHVDARIAEEREKVRQDLQRVYETEVERLRGCKQALEREIDELRKTKSVPCKDCDMLKHEIDVKDRDAMYARDQITELRSVCDDLRIEMDELRTSAEHYREQILQITNERQQNEANSDEASLQKKLDEAKLQIEAQLQRQLSAELRRSEAEKTALLEKLEREKLSVLENAQAEFAFKEQQYTDELKELRERIEDQMQQMSSLSDGEGSEEKRIIVELNQKVLDLQTIVHQLNGEVEHARREQKMQTDEATQKLADEIASYKAEVSRCHEEHERKIGELETTVAEQTNEVQQKAEELTKLKGQLTEAQQAKLQAEGKLQTSKSATLEKLRSGEAKAAAQLEAQRTKIGELEKLVLIKAEEKQTQSKTLEQALVQRDAQIVSLEASLRKLTSEVSSLNELVDAKSNDLSQVKRNTEEYIKKREKEQIKRHKRDLEALKKENAAAEQKCAQLEQELGKKIELLQTQLQREEQSAAALKLQAESVAGGAAGTELVPLSTLQTKLSEKEESVKKLQEEKQVLQAELAKTKAVLAALPRNPESIPSSPTKETSSGMSSPLGSTDNLGDGHLLNMRKRESICSTTSSSTAGGKETLGGASLSGDRENRRECTTTKPLVPRAPKPCSRGTSREQSRDKSPTVSHAHHAHSHAAAAKKAAQAGAKLGAGSDKLASTQTLNAMAADTSDDNASSSSRHCSRYDMQGSTSSLRPPMESRRSAGKSPARLAQQQAAKPGDKPKAEVPLSKRPAWRI